MKKSLGAILFALTLAGCGSDFSTEDVAAVPAPPSQPTLSGRVIVENGSPAPTVELIAQERTTREEYRATSQADGSYRLTLPAGVYDLALDRTGDTTTASCFYGPITVERSQNSDFVLRSSSGRNAQEVFGKISLAPGIAAAGRQITARPGAIHTSAPNALDAQTTTTDASGLFSLNLNSDEECQFDLEVYSGGGALSEFIDMGKLQKPCYVEAVVEQNPVVNLLRSTERGADPATASVMSQAAPGEFQNFASANYDLVLEGLDLQDGQIPALGKSSDGFYDNWRNLGSLCTLPNPVIDWQQELNDQANTTEIQVNRERFLFWAYSVNIRSTAPATFMDTRWLFTDRTNDEYVLTVIAPGSHYVCYNSGDPDIKRVQFYYP